MTVHLRDARDLTLQTVRRVAWDHEHVELADTALDAVARRRRLFLAFVEANRHRRLYGITTRHHHGATTLLDADERAAYGRHFGSAPSSTGPGLPERVRRTAVLARLADVLNGTAAVRRETAERLVGMLDRPMPYVPERGHGEPGNIMALGHLLRPVFDGQVEIGESMALMNGSPFASAVLADGVLAGRDRLDATERVLALAAVAVHAPDAHYDERLGVLWNDEHQAAALRRLRELLAVGSEHGADRPTTGHQSPVSFRSAPRVLGWTRRALAQAEECAGIALAASSNNPVFLGPDVCPPLGDVLSNGGYHHPSAAPCLDALTRAWADLAQLVTAQVGRLVEIPDGIVAGETEAQVSLFDMASSGWAEEARAAAQPSLIGLGPAGRTDTATGEMLAWRHARDAGEALEAGLAVLAVVAAHTVVHRRTAVPPALHPIQDAVLGHLPVGTRPLDFGDGLARIRGALTDVSRETTHRGASTTIP